MSHSLFYIYGIKLQQRERFVTTKPPLLKIQSKKASH